MQRRRRRPPCRAARVSTRRWFSRMTKSANPSRVSTSLTRRQHFGFDDRRGRPDRVDVALVELAEAAARRAIRPPHGLNLVPLEELRQLRLVLRDDARERHRQVVAQRQVGLAARLVLAALQDLEDELIALFAVLARAASRCSRTPASRAARSRSARTRRRTTPMTYSRRRTSSGRKSRVPRAGWVGIIVVVKSVRRRSDPRTSGCSAHFRLREQPPHLARAAHHERPGRHRHAPRSPACPAATIDPVADVAAVEQDGAHPDQALVLDRAAVDDGRVADRHVVADCRRVRVLS